MTIGIYSITHRESGRRYIGKSINVEVRWYGHRCSLKKPVFNKRICNRHLWADVQTYGIDGFDFEILEPFDEADEELVAARELFWIDHFKTTTRAHGYNLRRDSSTRMIVHEETRAKQSENAKGDRNPNFGNTWSEDQKARMRVDAQDRHFLGIGYGQEWRAKQSVSAKETWKDPEKRRAMGKKVSLKKQKYNYLQYTRDGAFIRLWVSIGEIVAAHPEYKWQNIYNVCHGHKPTYMGFIWKQELKVLAA